MFTVALSFLIFGSVSFNLIGNLIEDVINLSFASDIYATSILSSTYDLPYQNLKKYLDDDMKNDSPIVEYYAFTGVDFNKAISKFASL